MIPETSLDSMTPDIVIPEKILQGIREDGISEAKRRSSAMGLLLGLVDGNGIAYISERLPLTALPFKPNLPRRFLLFLRSPWIFKNDLPVQYRAQEYNRELMSINQAPAEIFYDTFPLGVRKPPVPHTSSFAEFTADLLYDIRTDYFEALDSLGSRLMIKSR